MNVEHLREFAVLARIRNFTKAARELNLAQSTLSKHIASLESQVGFSLFDRTDHTVVLTEAGKAMFESTLLALKSLDEGLLRARLLAKTGSLPIRIGGYLQVSSISNWIYRVETLMRQDDQSARISLYSPHTIDYMPDSSRDDALDLLRHDMIDFAVIEGPESYPELAEFQMRRIFDEPIVFFASSVSPLATKRDVDMLELRGKRFVGSLNYPQFQDRIREICASRGFIPEFGIKMADTFNEFMRSDDPEEVFFLSASGAARVPDPPFSPLVKLHMDDRGLYSPVYLVWNRKPTRPEVQAFLDAATKLAG